MLLPFFSVSYLYVFVFFRRVFLGFLKGTYWLVSYRSGMDPLYTFEALENNIDMDTNTFSSQNSSGLVLEFWLYNSKRPLELVRCAV